MQVFKFFLKIFITSAKNISNAVLSIERWNNAVSCEKLDADWEVQLAAYLVKRILGLLLRILWQLLHFHKHAVQLRLSLVGIILQDVTDARVYYLGEDTIADCCESQNKQGDSHHAAAAAAGPAAAFWEGCGDDAEQHKQRHRSGYVSITQGGSSPHTRSPL